MRRFRIADATPARASADPAPTKSFTHDDKRTPRE